MNQEKRKYSLDFKMKAVELSNHRSELASVAEELGIPVKNLSRWKHEYSTGKLDLLNKTTASKSKEELENIALKKALREVELERDILKKALGIFSRSDK